MCPALAALMIAVDPHLVRASKLAFNTVLAFQEHATSLLYTHLDMIGLAFESSLLKDN